MSSGSCFYPIIIYYLIVANGIFILYAVTNFLNVGSSINFNFFYSLGESEATSAAA